MPIPFEELSLKQLLHHKLAYDCINEAGKKLLPNWDMIAFEKSALADELYSYPLTDEQIRILKNSCACLNTEMPYLKYSDAGTHYGYELFSMPPEYWGSRGAPLYWAYLSREFTLEPLPMDDAKLKEKYLSIAASFGIPRYKDEKVYIERFAAGGMSSGIVCSSFVDEQLQVLRKRNRPFINRHKYTTHEIQYLEGAYERIDYLCKTSGTKKNYRHNPDLDFDTLLFCMESECTLREFEMLSLKWGIFTGTLLKNAQTAKEIGVTFNRIPQIERNSFRKIIKHPEVLIELDDALS